MLTQQYLCSKVCVFSDSRFLFDFMAEQAYVIDSDVEDACGETGDYWNAETHLLTQSHLACARAPLPTAAPKSIFVARLRRTVPWKR